MTPTISETKDTSAPALPCGDADTDVLIVGAGPIGLELACVLKHMGVDYQHVEAQQVAQTISWYPQQATFFSSPDRIAIAGVPLNIPDQTKASKEQYLAYLRGIVEQFSLNIETHTRVTGITRDDATGTFTITTDRRGTGRTRTARHIVLAIGDMHAPRKLGIEGEDLPHVSHYFVEPHRYFQQRLLIVGGKNSAAEAALRCERAGAHVAISYRQEAFDPKHVKYWLLPELNALIKAGRIAFYPQTVPVDIDDESVTLRSATGDDAQRVPADFVLLLTGYEMDPTLYEQAGIELIGDNRAPTVDPATMQSNVPGLYIAGTGAAGTQNKFSLFIENSHPHVAKIARSITGRAAPEHLVNAAAKTYELKES